MLLSNQRLDKLAAARVDFSACGMLKGPLLPDHLQDSFPHNAEPTSVTDMDEDDDDAVVEGPKYVGEFQLAKCAGACSQLS